MVMVVGGSFLLREASVGNEVPAVGGVRQRDYTVKEMLKMKEAYQLFMILFTACMGGLYLIGSVKDIGVSIAGLDAATAANAVALVAIFNTTGRIALGTLSDKLGRLKVIAGALLATAVAVTILSFIELNFILFFTCVAVIAFSFGGTITIFPALIFDFFGLKNSGKNYSVIYQGFGLGALSGSFIASALGGFVPTFTLIGVLSTISVIIALTIKAPAEKEMAKQRKLIHREMHA